MFKRVTLDPQATAEQTAWDKNFNKVKSAFIGTMTLWQTVLWGGAAWFFYLVASKVTVLNDSNDSQFKVEMIQLIRTDITSFSLFAGVVVFFGILALGLVRVSQDSLGNRPEAASA